MTRSTSCLSIISPTALTQLHFTITSAIGRKGSDKPSRPTPSPPARPSSRQAGVPALQDGSPSEAAHPLLWRLAHGGVLGARHRVPPVQREAGADAGHGVSASRH
ncbi:hypothetical protein N656DRAFT_14265 [Canariomyces notabilis]|uniref:Uncharacterized protein n=1 Tax=Canariomyces notabilis TaxID=2074819 RepID=A0AAN6YY82_9PEZI|nr:hypothetical protein N656DRAFT_14265 [Canariomyces arenarius]